MTNRDWLTVIGALLHDSAPEGRKLAETLLAKTKHGRQVRILRLITRHHPTIEEMQKTAKMSRRTIFRYLNSIEDYGVVIRLDETFRYHADRLPASLNRLM